MASKHMRLPVLTRTPSVTATTRVRDYFDSSNVNSFCSSGLTSTVSGDLAADTAVTGVLTAIATFTVVCPIVATPQVLHAAPSADESRVDRGASIARRAAKGQAFSPGIRYSGAVTGASCRGFVAKERLSDGRSVLAPAAGTTIPPANELPCQPGSKVTLSG